MTAACLYSEVARSMEEEMNRKETFIVHIISQENTTWQGQVTWAEKEKIQSFRSALELIKLMDSALDSQSKTGEENAEDIGGDHEA